MKTVARTIQILLGDRTALLRWWNAVGCIYIDGPGRLDHVQTRAVLSIIVGNKNLGSVGTEVPIQSMGMHMATIK